MATYEPWANLQDNVSQSATSKLSPPSEALSSSKEATVSVAANISSRPISSQDPDVWGVLTAISKRHQGKNILLTADKHCRSVEDWSFQIESNLVSDKQCKIYRKKITDEDTQQSSAVFLKATSNESTFLNWGNLRKNSPGLKMQHGDII